MAGTLSRALDTLPVVVLTGPRQVGKTTLLQQDAKLSGRRYLTLDDFAVLEAARSQPEALLGGGEPVTIDEAQRCPELLVAIKRAVDRERRPGQFLLSGSANLALLRGTSDTLAGRAIYLTLHPFTRRELRRGTRSKPFLARFFESPEIGLRETVEPIAEEDVLLGGLPPVATGEARDPRLWFLGYEQTYLERDVRDLSQVADLVTFRNLLLLTALRTGRVLNQSELARDAKLPVSTVARYLGLLEATFVISRVAPFLRSRASRLIKSPRIYVTDSGLACHLTSALDISVAADEPLRGPLFETYVYQNIAGILAAHAPDVEIGFWSIQGRSEVDFVISRGRKSLAVEVKAGSQFGRSDLAGLRAFLSRASGEAAAVLAYNGTEAVKLGDALFAVPLGLVVA
jgi:uncharacterized protein